MYSIVWITIGIIAYGLLTGIVYTEVTKVNSPPPADISGKNVGSLLFREYDAIMIGRSGGKTVRIDDELSYTRPYIEFLKLVEKLEDKKIDGIAIDRFTVIWSYWTSSMDANGDFDGIWRQMGYTDNMIKSNKDRIKFLKKLVKVKVPQTTSQIYTYGILVKNREDYLFFKSAAEDLGQTIGREWEQWFQNTVTDHPTLLYSAKDELYSYTGSYFQNTVIAVGITMILICVFGTVYELIKKGKCGQSNASVNVGN